MNSLPRVGTTRREYRLGGALIFLFVGLGILFACLAFVMALNIHSSSILPLVMPFVFLTLGAGMIAWPMRAGVVIDGRCIRVQGILRARSADVDEIEGFRTIQSRNGSYTELYLKQGRGRISISSSFNFDDDARAWFRQLVDLDKRDRETLLDEISHEQELGTTPEERLGKLANAKTWGIFLTVVSVAAVAALLLARDSLRVPAGILLAAMPLTACLLMQRSPLLYTVFKQRVDPRAELSFVLIVCGIGMTLFSSGLHFVSMQPLMLVMVPVGIAFLLGFHHAGREGPQQAGRVIGLLFFAGLYAFGVGTLADTIADQAPATTYSADVLSKHISHGRSTNYYLDLSPWGPMQAPSQVSVPAHVYGSLSIGDEVCLSLHPGSLHAAWYQVVDCTDRISPDFVR
jgi:hypothetical protein